MDPISAAVWTTASHQWNKESSKTVVNKASSTGGQALIFLLHKVPGVFFFIMLVCFLPQVMEVENEANKHKNQAE